MRYLDDGMAAIDNNSCKNQICPWGISHSNWLFASSLCRGKRAAALMTLTHSARLNGHDSYAYLKNMLARLPTQKVSELSELLPYNWIPSSKV